MTEDMDNGRAVLFNYVYTHSNEEPIEVEKAYGDLRS